MAQGTTTGAIAKPQLILATFLNKDVLIGRQNSGWRKVVQVAKQDRRNVQSMSRRQCVPATAMSN